MTQEQVLQDIAIYAVQASFWAALVFPVVTALYWPWWKHAWGVTIVSLDTAIALALLGDTLVFEFGLPQTGETGFVLAWIEVVALCLIPLIVMWRVVLIFITQRRGRRREGPDGRGPG